MADSQESKQQDVKDADQSKQKDVKDSASSQDVTTVPYSRFKEVNDELKQYREAEEKRKADQRKAEEEQARKKGEFESLLKQRDEELASEKRRAQEALDKASKYEAEQVKIRESALSKIKDDAVRTIAAKLPEVSDIVAFVEKLETTSPYSGKGGAADKDNPMKAKPGETYAQWQSRLQAEKQRKG